MYVHIHIRRVIILAGVEYLEHVDALVVAKRCEKIAAP